MRPHSAMTRVTVFLALALGAVACSGDRLPEVIDRSGGTAPGDGNATLPHYRVMTLTSWGRVTGRVDIDGDRPRDTTVTLTYDQQQCGATLLDTTLTYDGGVVGAVVWLEDVRTGKALPVERRYELTNDRCQLFPRVQAAIAGGTLNIRSLDSVEHRTRLTREPDRKPAALVGLHMSGQVVPVENVLAKPGRVQVKCDRHPWTRGWILVFDQPYFAQTAKGGTFLLDSVPPGRYRLVAWHERFGSVEQNIAVTANAETKAPMKFIPAKR